MEPLVYGESMAERIDGWIDRTLPVLMVLMVIFLTAANCVDLLRIGTVSQALFVQDIVGGVGVVGYVVAKVTKVL